MTFAARRRSAHRAIILDKSLEALPVFRLSDSADESAISYSPPSGGRWRVLPNPGDRLPGTFDQDVYVEILRRYSEAGFPSDGMVSFTLHAFLRSIGRRVDGRTYEQLRSAFNRLEKTILESTGVYFAARANTTSKAAQNPHLGSHRALRLADREQFTLFPVLPRSAWRRAHRRSPSCGGIRAGCTAPSRRAISVAGVPSPETLRLLEVRARRNGHLAR